MASPVFNGNTIGTNFPVFNSLPSGLSTLVAFGDSITAGTGASPSSNRYSTVLANALGLTEVNEGLSGSKIQHASDQSILAAIDRYTTDLIPNCNSHSLVVILYGINDVGYAGADTSLSPANAQSNLTTIVQAVINAGTPANQIILCGLTATNPAGTQQGSTAGSAQQNAQWKTFAYTQAIANVAVALKTRFVSLYDVMAFAGGNNILSDGLHPNNTGHALIASTIQNHADFLLGMPALYGSGVVGALSAIGLCLPGNGSGGAGLTVQNIQALPGTGIALYSRNATPANGNIGINNGNGQTGGLVEWGGGTTNYAQIQLGKFTVANASFAGGCFIWGGTGNNLNLGSQTSGASAGSGYIGFNYGNNQTGGVVEWGGTTSQYARFQYNRLSLNDSGGGPTITTGSGAPSSTQPNGSLYMRSDGATGSRLYVSAGGGTWNAVAGV